MWFDLDIKLNSMESGEFSGIVTLGELFIPLLG